MSEPLTEAERLDRLEDAVREIALFVAPQGFNSRILGEPATSAIVTEATARRDAEGRRQHRARLSEALQRLDDADAGV